MPTDNDIKGELERALNYGPRVDGTVHDAIRRELSFSYDRIGATAANGSITLTGEVDWAYQRARAGAAARQIRGAGHISNKIELKPRLTPSEIRHKVEDAFKRDAQTDPSGISEGAERVIAPVTGALRSWAAV